MIASSFLLFLSYKGRAITVYPLNDEGVRGTNLLHTVRNPCVIFSSPKTTPNSLLLTGSLPDNNKQAVHTNCIRYMYYRLYSYNKARENKVLRKS